VLLCHNAGIAVPLIAATLEKDMTSKPTDRAAAKPSRKARVRELYKEAGAEEAWVLGHKLKLKNGTLRSWFGTWRREAAKAKAERTRARTAKRNVTKEARRAEGKAELAKLAAGGVVEPPSGFQPCNRQVECRRKR